MAAGLQIEMMPSPLSFGSSVQMIKNALRRLILNLSGQIANSPVLQYPLGRAAAIVMFHEVQEDVVTELGTGCRIEFLSRLLSAIRERGLEIVSLDQALERIAGPASGGFVALTFDDGYRDTLTRALPVLEEHSAPFVVYVPTKAITRELDAWWLGLRAIFQQNDTVIIDAMGRRFDCPNVQAKMVALRESCDWAAANPRETSALHPTFMQYGVSMTDLVNRYFLNAEELITLARHPLATVGSHTLSHTALSTLEAGAMYFEMRESRRFLQTLIERDVRHLAYPYGSRTACGPREFAAAEQLGFSSAVTAINRPLFGRPSRYSLPRMNLNREFWVKVLDQAFPEKKKARPAANISSETCGLEATRVRGEAGSGKSTV